jgi:hypothetical protein
MVDLDEIEDSWIDGEKTKLDIYGLIKKYEIKGAGLTHIKNRLDGWYADYYDAYHKKCEQAVEGYSHLKRSEIKRRLDEVTAALSDIEKARASEKAKRTVRKAKPKAADKQVQRLQYKTEDVDLKVASVNPTTIIGASRLIVLNTKYKTITEYISNSTKGFEVKGTTLQNWDSEESRMKKLRKPDEFIPIAQKTQRQFNKAFGELTTKQATPNGRINSDCVLLKVDR